MPKLTEPELAAFLAEPGVLLHIAVTREDGSPLVTPIWFICEDKTIWFTPRAKSEWYACLRRDPRVSLCIDEQALPYRKLIVDGVITVTHDIGDDDAWRSLYLKIAERYVGPAAAAAYVHNTIDQPRALLSLRLGEAKVTTWRMPVDDEPVTGIWHDRYYAPGSEYANLAGRDPGPATAKEPGDEPAT